MNFEPFYYQQYCIDRIVGSPEVGLFLDMGMGKTVIALTAANELLYGQGGIRKVLIIAPLLPAKETWPQEIKKWDHLRRLRASLAIGTPAQREKAVSSGNEIHIINRENVAWLVKRFGSRWPYDMVIIDELSSFKSASSVRFRELRKVRQFITRIVGLTGTPAPNSLIDLWPQVFLLDQGKALGKTLTGYRDRYFLPDQRGPCVVYTWKLRNGAAKAIYSRLDSLCISMKSADYLQLPERLDIRHEVKMGASAMAAYRRLEKTSLLCFEKGGDIDGTTAAVLANKLLQAAGGAAYDDAGEVRVLHKEKLEALEDLVEAANGQPVLLFYAYKHEHDRIKEMFPHAVDIKSKNAVELWNSGGIQLMLAHPAAAGHGLNLQHGGHIIIWYGMTYSLELYQQANRRLHRIGQKYPVLVHHLIMSGTIEEPIYDVVLTAKEARQNALLDALKARFNEGSYSEAV